MSFEWCFTTYILHECSLKFFLDLNIVIWGINWLKIKDCDTLVYAKLSNSYATCDLAWPLMTASGLYWLVYEMYRYQAGKISFIKIRNRSAWNKNILCQILINIFYILVFLFGEITGSTPGMPYVQKRWTNYFLNEGLLESIVHWRLNDWSYFKIHLWFFCYKNFQME